MSLNEIVNPQFELMEVGSFDSSVANTIFRQYSPDITPTRLTTQIVINVRDLREFVSLSNSFIEIRGTFQRDDATVLAVGDKPALECGATSLFNQSRLRINQVLVEDNFSLSHHNAFIKQLTSQSKDFNDTIGSNSGFIIDRATGLADEVPLVLLNAVGTVASGGAAALMVGSNASYNAGYAQRRADAGSLGANTNYAAAGKVIRSYTVRLSDLFSFCTVNKVLRGVTIRIELGLRSLAERMFQATANGEFSITDCNLYLAIVEPSLPVLARLEEVLSTPVDIPYSYVNFKTYQSDTNNNTNRSFTFTTQAQRPIGAFVYAQKSVLSAAGSDQTFNSFIYDQCNTNYVQLRVNNKLYPYQPFEPVFGANGSYVARPYEELVKYMSKNYNVDSGALFTQREWESMYTIYYVNFGALPESNSYQITLDTKATAALAADVGSRGQTTSWYLTLMTLAQVSMKSDGNGVSIYSV
jgi:hypothetical protein